MDTQFSIVYDVLTAGILIGMLFAGFKKGFASAVVSLAAVAAAFVCAMLFSAPIADFVYSAAVEKPVKSTVNIALDEAMGAVRLEGFSELDYSEIEVSGVPISEIVPDYNGTNKALFDLADVDLSGTGIAALDLTQFGVKADTDFTSVNAKTTEFTRTDIERYGIDKMVMAQYIAVSMQNTILYENLADFAEGVGEAAPIFFGQMSEDISKGSVPAIRSVVLVMLQTSVSAREAVVDGIVEPCVKLAVQTIAFGVIFIAAAILLSLLAKMLKFVNKIPLIGGVNIFLGGVVGLAEGFIGVCAACLVVRLIITLTGGNVMFLNDAAVEATFAFKYFYGFEFLNFLK